MKEVFVVYRKAIGGSANMLAVFPTLDAAEQYVRSLNLNKREQMEFYIDPAPLHE